MVERSGPKANWAKAAHFSSPCRWRIWTTANVLLTPHKDTILRSPLCRQAGRQRVPKCTGFIGGFHGDNFKQKALPGLWGLRAADSIQSAVAERVVDVAGAVTGQTRELDDREQGAFDIPRVSLQHEVQPLRCMVRIHCLMD